MTTKNKKAKAKPNKRSFARGVNVILSGKFLTREYVQSNLSFIVFMVAIMVVYIGYGYFAEQNLKDLAKNQSELQEIKARNLSTRAKLEQLKQQSQVAESIKDLGLRESTNPPFVIRVDGEHALENSSANE